MGLDQLLKCLGLNLYPFHFSCTVPLSKKSIFLPLKIHFSDNNIILIDYNYIEYLFNLSIYQMIIKTLQNPLVCYCNSLLNNYSSHVKFLHVSDHNSFL